MLTYSSLSNFFCVYFPNSLIIFFEWRFFFWLFQFQFQFFTLNTENSDKTKSRKVDCDSDMTNLSLQERFFSRKVISTNLQVLIIWQLGGVPRTGGSRLINILSLSLPSAFLTLSAFDRRVSPPDPRVEGRDSRLFFDFRGSRVDFF